ncbi:MAG TPA: bifunctional glycosyltransferase/class I SAM-dependent methyltransferase [Myxococcaceae bacterium]|nr:bifunctional glycosyltransferase/class I SAM-dependent methyltransferase [Myxococcaceae bacterium]
MPPAGRPRLLVFVIAYQAEATLTAVLERIPRSVLEAWDTEILVVDDASADRTYAIGRAYQAAHPDLPLTVLRNAYNQGYGGNQKVGYAYAIARGFDVVAMVHGDGQYAPEELPRLLAPLGEGTADAVFGSRMMPPSGALRGGMPLYKFVGNRILTTLQNALLGTRLSEFHSGYRLYRVATLSTLPFALNSNDFHFDTEIILQLLNAGARIVELPIPTYYGDEISRVNGLAYAWNVVSATLQNALHRTGLLYQRRFDVAPPGDTSHYSAKLDYPSSHTYALAAVPPGSRVLDLGAGPGPLAERLVEKGCTLTLVDRAPSSGAPPGTTVLVRDLDREPLDVELGDADVILLLDVLEHLRDPERFLASLRRHFDFRPRTVVLTTPNVAFLIQRLMLLLGQFNYGKAGILDRTHTRLFTFRTFTQLLRDAGLSIRRVRGVPAPFPKALGDNVLARALLLVNRGLIRLSKALFAYQIYVEAETTPDLSFVLADTLARRTAGDAAPSAPAAPAAQHRR